MDTTMKRLLQIYLLLILLPCSLMLFLPLVKSHTDYTSLVYTKCANPILTVSIDSHSQALSSLFQQLLAQSSRSNFFKTIAAGGETFISGLYQCRGDLRGQECYDCINNTLAHHLPTNPCKAGRIELNGCYFQYETDGLDGDDDDYETPNYELVHEGCGEKKAVEGGFVEVRDAAFMEMESDDGMREKGFYEGDYEYVHVIGQCEGDLRGCKCGECVGSAVEIAQRDCGSSFSGKIYMDKCFLSYNYNPHGKHPEEKTGNGGDTGKKVAIVVGGAVALVAAVVVLKHMKSRCNKDDT